jgi:hypothetical protein
LNFPVQTNWFDLIGQFGFVDLKYFKIKMNQNMDFIMITVYLSFIFFSLQEKIVLFYFNTFHPSFYERIKNKENFQGTWTSLLHSLLNSMLLIYILIRQWNLFYQDPVHCTTFESNFLFSMSLGYFCYDTLSMQVKGLYEFDKTMILHHLMTVYCMRCSFDQF